MYPVPERQAQLYMKALFVDRDMRGQGIGLAIMKFLARYALASHPIIHAKDVADKTAFHVKTLRLLPARRLATYAIVFTERCERLRIHSFLSIASNEQEYSGRTHCDFQRTRNLRSG